jgi:hypothetical protein
MSLVVRPYCLWLGIILTLHIASPLSLAQPHHPTPPVPTGPGTGCCPPPVFVPGTFPGMPPRVISGPEVYTPPDVSTPITSTPTQPGGVGPGGALTGDMGGVGADTGRGGIGGGDVAANVPSVIGDLLSPRQAVIERLIFVPGSATPTAIRAARVSVPASVASFKIAENEPVRPVDRIFFNFNYFSNVNDAINTRLGNQLGTLNIHREVLGFEKTFLDGLASFGLRLPINTLSVSDGAAPGFAGTYTDIGDVSLIIKAIMLESADRRSVITGGLVTTLPTGPTGIGGSDSVLFAPRGTFFQPFLGFQLVGNLAYIQGFSSIDIPTSNAATLFFNTLSAGVFLYNNNTPGAFLRSVVPISEIHINTPLSHRNWQHDPLGVPDIISLTQGLAFILGRRGSTLTFGVSEPITGPRPYDIEAIAQFNLRF